jgi:hypothetical protein
MAHPATITSDMTIITTIITITRIATGEAKMADTSPKDSEPITTTMEVEAATCITEGITKITVAGITSKWSST